MPVAPRIVNDVSYVSRNNTVIPFAWQAHYLVLQLFSVHFSKIWDCNFAWQAQYLVRLEVDACCSAHCK